MKDLQREILNQVASGTITAEEGASRLEALEAAPPPPAPSTAAREVRQVRVISRFGNAEIVGDPAVAVAVADGPHNARHDGDTMVIEQSPVTDDTAFEFNRPYARVVIPGFDFHRKLVVRVNPSLTLRATVQAGNLRVDGMKGSLTCDVQAGNCTASGFEGPINLAVAAGSLEAGGRLRGGESSIRCQMGEVKVNLDRTSDVRISAHTTMGRVDVDGARDRVIGKGTGTLDIDCTMGDVKVSVV